MFFLHLKVKKNAILFQLLQILFCGYLRDDSHSRGGDDGEELVVFVAEFYFVEAGGATLTNAPGGGEKALRGCGGKIVY